MFSIRFNHSYTDQAKEKLVEGLDRIRFECECSDECWMQLRCTGCVYAELCRDLRTTLKYLKEQI